MEETTSSASWFSRMSPKKKMILLWVGLGVLLLITLGAVVAAVQYKNSPGATPTPTPTQAVTPTPEPSPTANLTPTKKITPTRTPTPTPKAPTPTPTPATTSTPTPTPTPTPSAFQVTGVTAAVAPTTSNSCPGTTTFNFSATITANAAGTVTYKWERSDGASSPNASVVFDAAGNKTITDTWTMGAAGTHWEKVHILTPNDTSSNQATFTMTCP